MKITIITKECKTKDKNATAKANLCFRLRDKDVDLKSVPTLRISVTIGTMMHFTIDGQRKYHLTSRRKSRFWCRPL